MALDKTSLAAGIKALGDDLYNNTNRSPDEALQHYADQMATLIEAFVKSGTPMVPGLGLTTPAGGGAVTGTSSTGTIE